MSEEKVSAEKTMTGEKTTSGKKTMSEEKTMSGEKTISGEKTMSGEKPVPGEETMSRNTTMLGEKSMSREKAMSGEKEKASRKTVKVEKTEAELASGENITEESVMEPIIVKEVYTFREMMEAIPFLSNERKRLKPQLNTLILFVSMDKEVTREIYSIEKTKEELSIAAEQNVNWVLSQFLQKFEDKGLLFLIVRLSDERWMPRDSEFQKNKIIKIMKIPTLVWFDKPYSLQGHDATDLMSIRNMIDLKLKDIEFHERFEPLVKEPTTEIEFEKHPRFRIEYLNFKAMDEADAEADKRIKQVVQGKCTYDAMTDAFTILNPEERKRFLEELDAAESDMLPFGGTYERREDVERPIIELELEKPSVKKELYTVERFPMPKPKTEEKEILEKKAKKPILKKGKRKGKKGKGKKGKGKKGKGKKGKGKGGKGKPKGGLAKGKGGKKGGVKKGGAKKK